MSDICMNNVKSFVLDVDGVLTDGRYYYTTEGKVMKQFGPDDHDALLLLKEHVDIHFVTGDRKGFAITEKRVLHDMKFPLDLVSTFERVQWLLDKGFDLESTIYMGDGIFDAAVFSAVGYGIAPKNAFYTTLQHADFVTSSEGGNSAVAEACIHILEKFFQPFDPLTGYSSKGGEWEKQT